MHLKRILLSAILFQFGCGCASYSTLQTATTLDKGEIQVGAGSAFDAQERMFAPEVGVRYGLIDRLDLGVKYVFPSLVFGDLKFQVLKGPVDIAADAGISYFQHNATGLGEFRMIGFYPMLLVGQEHWYTGVKSVFVSASGETDIKYFESYQFGGYSSTNFVLGASLGEKVRFLPELNVAVNKKGEIHYIPAVAFQVGFK